MLFCRVEEGVAVQYPLTERQVRQALGDYSLPQHLTNVVLEPLGFAVLEEMRPDNIPQVTKDINIALSGVFQNEEGNWERVYTTVPVPDDIREVRLQRKWREVREKRDVLMADIDWRILRHTRQVRLGIEPSDDLASLDTYMQALADITLADDPFTVEFPPLPFNKDK